MKSAFSLLEIIIVVIIVSILASIAFPGMVRMYETNMDKEAMSSLKLIQAAEDSYYLEESEYFETDVGCETNPGFSYADTINSNLVLRLSTINWEYCVDNIGGFSAWARRTMATNPSASPYRTLVLRKGSLEACCDTDCKTTTPACP